MWNRCLAVFHFVRRKRAFSPAGMTETLLKTLPYWKKIFHSMCHEEEVEKQKATSSDG